MFNPVNLQSDLVVSHVRRIFAVVNHPPGEANATEADSDEVRPIVDAPRFRGANLRGQTITDHEWLLSGVADSGKTWAALWRLDAELRRTPGAKASLARKLQVDIYGTVLQTWNAIQQRRFDMGEPQALPFGGERPQWYRYPNGAILFVGGMDNPQKLLSSERDFIYINQAEELKLEDWETLATRCSGRGAVTSTPMLFGDCNPHAADHWILKRPSIRLLKSTHKDNPSLYNDQGTLYPSAEPRIAALQSLTGVRRKRLYEGLWVGSEGTFFEEFDPEDNEEHHIIEPFDIPADWYVWAAFDYGFAHNTAWGLFTEHDGVIYKIAEHLKNKLLPPAHCKLIRRQCEKVGVPFYHIKRTVAGHDCFQQRGDKQGKTIAEQYAEAVDSETGEMIGFEMERATVDRVTGWAELLTRLGNREANIKPTLKIFNTCKRTIETLGRMVADPNDAEDVKKVDSNEFGEGGDDAADELRMAVMARKYKPTTARAYNY